MQCIRGQGQAFTSESLTGLALRPGAFQLATEHLVNAYHTPDP